MWWTLRQHFGGNRLVNEVEPSTSPVRKLRAYRGVFVVRTDLPATGNTLEPQLRRWFILVAVLVAMWVVVLGALSLLTANLVSLNRDQILESAEVLTVVVEDIATGQVRVEKSWKGAIGDRQINVANLRMSNSTTGQRMLIPVSMTSQGWQVTLSKLPGNIPLVYPVTEDSEQQLRDLLQNRRQP